MAQSIFNSLFEQANAATSVIAHTYSFNADANAFCLASEYCFADFLKCLQSFNAYIQDYKYTTIVLACAEPFSFLVGLFAAAECQLSIVVPPNLQPKTLERFVNVNDTLILSEQLANILLNHSLHTSLESSIKSFSFDPCVTQLQLYTSGSTGEPQIIQKTFAQLEAEILALADCWQHLPLLPVLATVPHYHIYGILFRLLFPLYTKRIFVTNTLATPHEIEAFTLVLKQFFLISSPSQLSHIQPLIGCDKLTNKTIIFSSGGALSFDVAASFADAQVFPYEVYGSTETGGVAWRQQCLNPVWQPLPNVVIGIAASGRLLLSSPWSSISPFVAIEGNDLISLESNGFTLLGRADRVVKIGEKRLDLHQLELSLLQHAYITAVSTLLLTKQRVSLAAVVVLSPEGLGVLHQQGKLALIKKLRQYVSDFFDLVLVPRYWRFVPALPFDERGKLPQHVLQELFIHE